MKHKRHTDLSGFTIVELLVVISIIAVLMALLFPAFQRARENSYQAHCMSNLHQIGMAVQMYKQDEKYYPSSLTHLVSTAAINQAVVAAGGDPLKADPTSPDPNAAPAGGNAPIREQKSFAANIGYINSYEVLECPDDDTDANKQARSSYGDIWSPVQSDEAAPRVDPPLWNYFGYNADGIALTSPAEAQAAAQSPGGAALLVDPSRPYDMRANPIRQSMSNRFSASDAIVTHCRHHRRPTSNLRNPDDIYNDPREAQGARDALLRVDGSAVIRDVSGFKARGQWQK